VLAKKPVEMPTATIEMSSQLAHRQAHQVNARKVFECARQLLFEPIAMPMALSGILELQGQYCSHDAEQLPPMVQVKLRRHLFQQTVALLGERAERRVKPEALERFRDLLEKRYLRGGKQRKQMLERHGKGMQNHFLDGRD
jgi:hypothetical protein